MGEFNRLISKDVNLNGNFSQAIQSAIKLKINSYTQNLEDEVNQALKQMDQFEKSSFTQEGFCIWDNPRRLWLEPQYLVCRNIKCKNSECFATQICVLVNSTYEVTLLKKYDGNMKVEQEVNNFIDATLDKWELVVSNGNSHLLHTKDINELNAQKDHLREMYENLIIDFKNSLEP